MPDESRRHRATEDLLQKRPRRIEAQDRSIQRMVDDECCCIDVVTQISAIQAALVEVVRGLPGDRAKHCIAGGRARGSKDELSDELMAAVGRQRKRG